MNLVDLALIIVIGLAVWAGWRRGFISGIFNLLAWISSLLLGFIVYKPLGEIFQSQWPRLGVWVWPLAFFTVVFLTRIILIALSNLIIRRTPEHVHTSTVNRFLGMAPGFVNGLVFAMLVTAILISAPFNDKVSEQTRGSLIASRLSNGVAWLDQELAPIFDSAVQESMTRLTVEPESGETVNLYFKVNNSQPRPDLEAQMLILVNQERVKRGIPPLAPDPPMVPVARAHSTDMFVRGYFSHYTPEGTDPFQRMKKGGINYITAGENLALGQTLKICHEGLMNSPGHKANILNRKYGRVGIGIMDGGYRGLMISQEFRN